MYRRQLDNTSSVSLVICESPSRAWTAVRFCHFAGSACSIEKSRAKSWSQANRVKSAGAFNDIDRDGSGMLSRDELEEYLRRMKVTVTPEKLTELIKGCDSDGDGNISYGEFVDGLARDLVAPNSIWGARRALARVGAERGSHPLAAR